MMGDHIKAQLIAYLATLATLALIFVAALVTGALSPAVIGKVEAFGLGTLTGGLIGVLRLPTAPAGSNPQTEANLATALDKLPPVTTGTGPSKPLDEGTE